MFPTLISSPKLQDLSLTYSAFGSGEEERKGFLSGLDNKSVSNRKWYNTWGEIILSVQESGPSPRPLWNCVTLLFEP